MPGPGGTIGQRPELRYDDVGTQGQSTVLATFPDHPALNCAIWCYEDELGQPTAWRMDGETLILQHRSEKSPNLKVTTRFTPCPDGISQVVTVEGDSEEETRAINQVNPCFQFRQSLAFGQAAGRELDYVDDFVARCFVFTDKGLTQLKDTQRFPCAMRPSKDSGDRFSKRANSDRPWIQSYSPAWERLPLAGGQPAPGFSSARITYPIMGVISHDGKYLAAVAWPETWRMNQLWLSCIHPWPCLLTADYDPASRQRVSRGKLYILPNDTAMLLERFEGDFPDWQALAERPTQWE
ncbi:MAG: hypothetical protein KAX19_09535 [Candidatus Brocadiae bacterium]|nr:hypothetical protein [Candidatus Brocadiia bacterium]